MLICVVILISISKHLGIRNLDINIYLDLGDLFVNHSVLTCFLKFSFAVDGSF